MMNAVNLSPENSKKQIERFALVAGILQPLMSIPQIIEIFSSRSASNVSLLTWGGYLLLGVIFFIYGLVFRLRPVWAGQLIWVVMQSLVVAGIILYG